MSEFQVINTGRQIRTTNQIEPFLHFIFVLKFGIFAFTFRLEELVQIEFVKFTLTCNLTNTFRNLVSHQHHTRESLVWIIFSYPGFFGALLIGIRPVKYLFFDEFTGIKCTERRSRKIEIILCRYWQERFIHRIRGFLALEFFLVKINFRFFVLFFEEILRIFSPCAKMVFVKND